MASHGIDPAFPPPGGGNKQGLTIRDYFAASALNGIMGAYPEMISNGEAAVEAYRMADAMLKARG